MNKKFLFSAFFGLLFLLNLSAHAETRTVKINGMHCEECAKSIKQEVMKIPGVTDVKVSVEEKAATITTKDGVKISNKDLKKAVETAGYKFVG